MKKSSLSSSMTTAPKLIVRGSNGLRGPEGQGSCLTYFVANTVRAKVSESQPWSKSYILCALEILSDFTLTTVPG